MNDSTDTSVLAALRRLLMPWGFALLLPVPVLLTRADSNGADIGALYLALGGAWLGVEAFRPGSEPVTVSAWRTQISALVICLVVNALVFTILGLAAGVKSSIPLLIMAAFCISPALGLVPWLTLRLRQPYGAIILGAMIVGLTKLASCVVVRIVYGPNALADGFMAADWRTAKLMISLMWTGTLVVSALGIIACHRRFAEKGMSSDTP